MKQVEHWSWRMRSETTGKVVIARWKMTAEDALARDPNAVRVPGSMELRTIYGPNEAPLHSTSTGRPKSWDDPF